jgi:flagellar biosynthetic protein FlhB
MAEQEQEQNRSEDATPFKLQRAREKGTVARSMDLGFFGVLVALAGFMIVAGGTLGFKLAELMRQSLVAGIGNAADPRQATALTAAVYRPAVHSIVLLGVTVLTIIIFLEIVQLRGFIFSTKALKPDFSRINPAKGFKRIFSVRMLKEALKNVVKLAAYSAATAVVILTVIAEPRRVATDAQGIAGAMRANGMWLLFLFVSLAFFFAAIDQILVRREFAKQMRMSRREVTRETREREGEPRLKQRRKQLHAEFRKQAEGMGKLPGSDLLIVNPEHFAIALAYDPANMAAPTVTTKARNHFALALKREAFRLGIPIFERPDLARNLFRSYAPGSEIGGDHYQPVADLYFKLRSKPASSKE